MKTSSTIPAPQVTACSPLQSLGFPAIPNLEGRPILSLATRAQVGMVAQWLEKSRVGYTSQCSAHGDFIIHPPAVKAANNNAGLIEALGEIELLAGEIKHSHWANTIVCKCKDALSTLAQNRATRERE